MWEPFLSGIITGEAHNRASAPSGRGNDVYNYGIVYPGPSKLTQLTPEAALEQDQYGVPEVRLIAIINFRKMGFLFPRVNESLSGSY